MNERIERKAILPALGEVCNFHIFVALCSPLGPQDQGFLCTLLFVILRLESDVLETWFDISHVVGNGKGLIYHMVIAE